MLRVCNQCHRLQKYIDFHDVRRRAAHLHGNASPPVLSGVTTQERMSCVLYTLNTLSSAAVLLTSCVHVRVRAPEISRLICLDYKDTVNK